MISESVAELGEITCQPISEDFLDEIKWDS